MLFSTYPTMEVVGTACDGKTALEEAVRRQPNVVLTDLRLVDMTGIDVCREIRSQMPQTQVVVLSAFLDDEAVLAAVVAGAAGFVLKSCPEDELAEAIIRAARGEAYLAGPAATRLLSFVRRAADCARAQRPMPLFRSERAALSRLNGHVGGKSFLETLPFKEYVGRAEWSPAQTSGV
jgi:DNA-binding NarL/FixJ family response regulator